MICLGVLAVIGATAVALFAACCPSDVRAGDITLIYVGADDCAPCRAWQRGDGATFRQSSDFSRLRYREVKAPHLQELLKDQYWPQDIRPFRDRLGAGSGVPLWLVVADDTVVGHGYGMSEWRTTIAPKLESLLR